MIREMEEFLANTYYVDYMAENIQKKAKELFSEEMTDVQKAEKAFLFVRDEIPHSFDCNATVVTARA